MSISLIFARAHVVPLEMARQAHKDQENHHDSIPRLELTAAALGVKVGGMVARESDDVYKRVIYWTDSECVLKWLRDDSTRFKMFIRNRLSKVWETCPNIYDWRYVPTHLNPADHCSRGMAPDDPKWATFHEGPEFLKVEESLWPQTKVPLKKGVKPVGFLPEMPELGIHVIQVESVPEVPPSASWALGIAETRGPWFAKLRRLAYFRKFVLCWEKWLKKGRAPGHERGEFPKISISVEDIQSAEKLLVREVQRKHFRSEMDRLKKMKVRSPCARQELRAKSFAALSAVDPFLDCDGLMRVGGRLENATMLAYDSKFPMILPGETRTSHLLCDWSIRDMAMPASVRFLQACGEGFIS